MTTFLINKKMQITLLCGLLVSTLPSCMMPADKPDFTPAIQQAKSDCSANTYPETHRNFLRVKCENIALRNIARPELENESFYAFDNFLIERLDIADQLDRRKITPEQSDIAILKAQQKLLGGYYQTEQIESTDR